MTVTIKDIAKAAEVSHTTVSRALRNKPSVSPQTVLKIKQIAESLGYVPNTIARGLKLKKSGILGVIVCRIGDPFFSEMLMGIEDVLHKNGYSIFFASSPIDSNRKSEIIQSMREHRVDGVIICSADINESQQRSLIDFGLPTLLINSNQNIPQALSVQHDDYYASEQLTGYLIKIGHRKIGFIGYSKSARINQTRLTAYLASLENHRLCINQNYILNYEIGSQKEAKQLAVQLVTLKDPPSALICFEDGFAIRMIRAFNQLGIQIPQHVSIAGFDNNHLSAIVEPSLTTFELPRYDLGCEAATLMLRYLNTMGNGSFSAEIQHKVLRGQLIIRESTLPFSTY